MCENSWIFKVCFYRKDRKPAHLGFQNIVPHRRFLKPNSLYKFQIRKARNLSTLIRCSRSSKLRVYIQKESTSSRALLLVPCLHTQLCPSYLVPGWSEHVGVGLNHQAIFSRPRRLSGCRFLILPTELSPEGTASGTELAPALPLCHQRIRYPKVPFHSQYGTKGTKIGRGSALLSPATD